MIVVLESSGIYKVLCPQMIFFFFGGVWGGLLSVLQYSKQLCNQWGENIVAILWAAGPCQLTVIT